MKRQDGAQLLLMLLLLLLLMPIAKMVSGRSYSFPIKIIQYSANVRFYTADGRLVHAYSSDSKPGSAFLCDFTGMSYSFAARVNYSLSLLHPTDAASAASVSIQGRLAVLRETPEVVKAAGNRRLVLACTVSYFDSSSVMGDYSRIVEWNLLIIDPQAAVSNSLSWSKPEWISSSGNLTMSSAKEFPLKTENNTVTCVVSMSPSKMEFVQLTVKKNDTMQQLRPTDLKFNWIDDGTRLSYNAEVAYRPELDAAADTFQCEAFDPMRSTETSAAVLKVPHKAGLSRLHLANSRSGEIITDESSISETELLECEGDATIPTVNYTWRVMRSDSLKSYSGKTLNLTGVNLYYPVCCYGENQLEGKIFKSKKCLSLRGKATFHTVNFFDFGGKRDAPLVCSDQAAMGLIQVRFSEIACNVAVMQNSIHGQECDTSTCHSETALSQVRRKCESQKRENFCYLDATWLMDTFMKNALRTNDAMPKECFAWEGALIRIEVDYFCTEHGSVRFGPTNVGQHGVIQTYSLPRTGCYMIVAKGASGGNHTTNYGDSGPGTWRGGRGAEIRGKFYLQRGLVLSIAVGQHGGNSSEISPTHRPSIEDNAGTGGGGGSFVYSGRTLYLAAGGSGGASYSRDGVHGQAGENGTDSDGPNLGQRGRGGTGGSAGWTNTEAASYHGGCGAGWFTTGSRRAGPEHGGPGHGGPLSGSIPVFSGGVPGGRNPGAFGGFGGGGGGSVDNGASGGGGGYSGGGAGTHDKQAGGGGGSYCNATAVLERTGCYRMTGGNQNPDGEVVVYFVSKWC